MPSPLQWRRPRDHELWIALQEAEESRLENERIAACDLLARLLAVDAADRPSAEEALAHALFDDLKNGNDEFDKFYHGPRKLNQSDLHVAAALGDIDRVAS